MNNLRSGTPEAACASAPLRAGAHLAANWRRSSGWPCAFSRAPAAANLWPPFPDPTPATRSGPSVQPALAPPRTVRSPRGELVASVRLGRVDGGDARSVTSYGWAGACAGVEDAEPVPEKRTRGWGPSAGLRCGPLRSRRACTWRLDVWEAGEYVGPSSPPGLDWWLIFMVVPGRT